MKNTIIIFALIITTFVSAFAQNSNKIPGKNSKAIEQITALTREFANALVKGDTATLERILAPDYEQIQAGGFPESKIMLIEYFKVNANTTRASLLKAIDIESNKLNVRIYDNTAIIGVFAVTKWLGANNQTEEQSFLATLVAIKKNGRWQFVAANSSELPKAQETKPRLSQ